MNKHAAIDTRQFVTIEAKALREAMKPIRFVIERRNTYPILSYVLLAFSGSELCLTGTDLDIRISTTMDVIDGQGSWSVAVDAATLSRIGAAHGTAAMRMEFVKGSKDTPSQLQIAVGDAEYAINTLDADGYPVMPGERGKKIESFTNGQLAQIFDKIRPAVSTEETRYYLSGIYWNVDGTRCRFVATDGHKLIGQDYGPPRKPEPGRIIPKKVVDLIRLHFKAADIDIFPVDQSKIEVVSGAFTFRAKLIEGTFPDVDRVIPKMASNPHKLALNKAEIMQAFRATAVMPSQMGGYGRALRFYPDGGRLHIGSRSPDLGTVSVSTQSEWPDEVPEFGLNSHYISDLILGCTGDVIFHLRDSSAPVRITDDDESMIRVLMPMRV